MCNLAGKNNHQKRVQQNGFSRMRAKISYICNTNSGERSWAFALLKTPLRLDLLFVNMHEKASNF